MLVNKLFWLHIYSTMLKMCFIYDILRKCTIYLYRFWFERWILCHGNSGHFSSKMRTNSTVDFICSYCPNLAILRGCLHDTGATFAPARVPPVPSHGSTFVSMIPPQNAMPARVTPAWVQPGCCTGARISLRYEISPRYHVNAKRPPASVWIRSVGGLERVAHA